MSTTHDYLDRLLLDPLWQAGRGLATGALALGLAGAAMPATAETPLLVGYQGAVFDASGQPAQGSVDVDVAIFDTAMGGTALYGESHPGVSLVDGTFDLQIGSGTGAIGTFDDQTFAGPEAWLELTVDGETLDPRQRLVAVPYALRAKVAESLDGSIGTVPHAATADRLTGSSDGTRVDMVYTGGDGAEIFFEHDYAGNGATDALVIEKTDINGVNPDGKIVFSNRGSDGISEPSLTIDGLGNVGIPATNATARLHVETSGQRALNLWTTHNNKALEVWNGGSGEAIVAQSYSSGYQTAAARIQNFNVNGGVAGYFQNQSDAGTVSVYNFGSGRGLIVRNTGESDILQAWTRPAGASVSTRQFWVDGSGVTHVRTLKIHGGADLSERFDVSTSSDGSETAIEPGTVVAIDPDRPGKLKMSAAAYSTRVAGIVAGAGGIEPGMLMHQEGMAETEGQHPVALTGRVYAKADTSNGPIRPGDLLTTSVRPGHAMKASDPLRAHGAVLGKAMTGLDGESGLILVLVNLH